ncbi:plus-3-domain-containing protein [Phellopilus nigrolimitatus]|nr:plus-3-domain-containing protein [Phellopilus nigrolimitatus]
MHARSIVGAATESTARTASPGRMGTALQARRRLPQYESEEDNLNPDPLEGKFVDETDGVKTTCLKAAKRAHQVRGATKEKTCKLDVLKAKRKAKSEKKRTRINSPKQKCSSSPMDMEISSEDEEDRQISRLEQQEERESRLLNKTKPEDEDLTMEDLEKCRLSRSKLVKYALMPWFEDFVKGSWVRYLIGTDQGQPVYRICEIANLGSNPAKPYKFENEYFDTRLELRHGAAIKVFPMDKVSNAAFTEAPDCLSSNQASEQKVNDPTGRVAPDQSNKGAAAGNTRAQADIPAILARKAELNHSLPKTRTTETKAALERAELVRMRALAQMHRDFAESAALDTRQGAVRKGGHPHEGERAQPTGEPQRCAPHGGYEAEAERRKKTRLTRAASATGSRPGTPGVFKCVLLLFFAAPARLTLPHSVSPQGLAERDADARRVACTWGGMRSKGVLGKRAFESIVASSVEVDLVDF